MVPFIHYSLILLFLPNLCCHFISLIKNDNRIAYPKLDQKLIADIDIQCLADTLNAHRRGFIDQLLAISSGNANPREEMLIKGLSEKLISTILIRNLDKFGVEQRDAVEQKNVNLLIFSETVDIFNLRLMKELTAHSGKTFILHFNDSPTNSKRMRYLNKLGGGTSMINLQNHSAIGQCNCNIHKLGREKKPTLIKVAFRTFEPFTIVDDNRHWAFGIELNFLQAIALKLNVSIDFYLEEIGKVVADTNGPAKAVYQR